MWLPTKTNLILLKVVAANDEVSQRTREGLAQLHSSLHLAFCERNVIVARFHVLVKLEKVEEEEAKALLENLPDEYAAMLGENQNWLTLICFHRHVDSADVLVRHPRLQDDWDGDPWGGVGTWRQDCRLALG